MWEWKIYQWLNQKSQFLTTLTACWSSKCAIKQTCTRSNLRIKVVLLISSIVKNNDRIWCDIDSQRISATTMKNDEMSSSESRRRVFFVAHLFHPREGEKNVTRIKCHTYPITKGGEMRREMWRWIVNSGKNSYDLKHTHKLNSGVMKSDGMEFSILFYFSYFLLLFSKKISNIEQYTLP